MRIDTTRFGQVEIEPHDLIHFPSGILGLEDCRQWVLLADAENDARLAAMHFQAKLRWPSLARGDLCRIIRCGFRAAN